MENGDYYLVYGGGKFAKIAIDKLKLKYPIISIDIDVECQVCQEFPPIHPIELLNILENDDLFSQTFAFNDKMQNYPVKIAVGGIPLLAKILQCRTPLYLLPIAPIHVMKDLIIHQIQLKHPSCIIHFKVPKLNENNLPLEINILSAKDTLYLSYAKWDELCPENCPAPFNYCQVHKRKKPYIVVDVLKQSFQMGNLFSFESEQLAPGIGGIEIQKMNKMMNKILSKLSSLTKDYSITIGISTSCRCHGVLDVIHLEI